MFFFVNSLKPSFRSDVSWLADRRVTIFKSVTCSEDWIDHGIDPEIVCTAMAKLLIDPDPEVRTVASANLGKVFVVLGPKKSTTPKSSPLINNVNPMHNVNGSLESDNPTPPILENGLD